MKSFLRLSRPTFHGICLIVCLWPVLCQTVTATPPVTQLKVMQFNIWPYGPNATVNNWVAVIRTNNADIIGLEEATAPNAQAIATQLGFYWTQGAGSAEC